MTATRSTKLLWIALICAGVGFLASRTLGAAHWVTSAVIIAFPVVIGLIFGMVGFDQNGASRNRKVIGGVALLAVLAAITVVALIVDVVLNSTDL